MWQNSEKSNELFLRKLLNGHTKNQFISLIFVEIHPILESCDWLKNPAIWLTKRILGHISGTRIFTEMNFVQAYKNYKTKLIFITDQINKKIKNWEKNWTFLYIQRTLGLAYFSHFWGKTWFSKNQALSHIIPHGPLRPCWVPEKTEEPVPRKLLKRRTGRPFIWENKSIEWHCCR